MSNVLLRTGPQLSAKFKHAIDFGVTGNFNMATRAAFSRAIHQHINSPNVRAIAGTFNTGAGRDNVIHYLNPTTGLNVVSAMDGRFISGWALNPNQLANVLAHGGL